METSLFTLDYFSFLATALILLLYTKLTASVLVNWELETRNWELGTVNCKPPWENASTHTDRINLLKLFGDSKPGIFNEINYFRKQRKQVVYHRD